jgi:hypothetical protein
VLLFASVVVVVVRNVYQIIIIIIEHLHINSSANNVLNPDVVHNNNHRNPTTKVM